MTLRLILTRHAKSSWDNPLADDHSRALNARGVGAASAIGRWLAVKKYTPDVVLCSSATRTRETWGLISESLTSVIDIRFEKPLYQSSPDLMLSTLNNISGANTVMIIAHNPGIASFASALATKPCMHPQANRYPSGATMILDFELNDWQNVAWGSGVVTDFVVPKELN